MKIIKVTLLIIGTSVDSHIDLVLDKLKPSVKYFRFNVDKYPNDVKSTINYGTGKVPIYVEFIENNICYDLSNLKAIWFRRIGSPTIKKFKDQAYKKFASNEVDVFLQSLGYIFEDKFWINNITSTKRAANKIYQLSIASKIGLIFPSTMITNDELKFIDFYNSNKKIIYKTLASPNILYEKSKGMIYTSIINDEHLQNTSFIQFTPCQFQDYAEKEFELRITIINDKIFAVKINSQIQDKTKVDWRIDMFNVEYENYKLPKNIESKLIMYMKQLDINYGAIDMIVTKDNEYIFLEINPHGAWGWIENRLNLGVSQEIADYLTKNSI